MEYKKLGILGVCSTLSLMLCDNVDALRRAAIAAQQRIEDQKKAIVVADTSIQSKEFAKKTTGNGLLEAIEGQVASGLFAQGAVDEIKGWKNDLGEITDNAATLKAKLGGQKAETVIDGLTNERDAARGDLGEITGNAATLKAKLGGQKAETVIDGLTNERDAARGDLGEITGNAATLKAKLGGQKAETVIDGLTNERDAARGDLGEITGNAATLKAKLGGQKAETVIGSLEAERDTATTKVDDINSKTTLLDLCGELDNAKGAVQMLEGIIYGDGNTTLLDMLGKLKVILPAGATADAIGELEKAYSNHGGKVTKADYKRALDAKIAKKP